MLAVVNANGYNAGSDLSEQMCESVAPTVRQRMKSHLHTVWLTRFQKSCADFAALRNISSLVNRVLFVHFKAKNLHTSPFPIAPCLMVGRD
jgi:hypothetical protein